MDAYQPMGASAQAPGWRRPAALAGAGLMAVVALAGLVARPADSRTDTALRGTPADAHAVAPADLEEKAKAFSKESQDALKGYLGGGSGAPLAKNIVLDMDVQVMLHSAWNDWPKWSEAMAPYWTEDMIYDFNYVGEWGFGPTRGLRGWYEGEHLHYNAALPSTDWLDMIRAANNQNATSCSYGTAQWTGDLAGVPPPADKPWVRIRDIDFYLLEGGRIKINWCLIDILDVFDQVGIHVLPPAPLPNLGYLQPTAMDGGPAPLSRAVNPQDTVLAEATVRKAIMEEYVQQEDAPSWHEFAEWYGPAGVGTARSRDQYVNHWLRPLRNAFSDIKMKLDILVCEGLYCGAQFYLWGNHTGEWMGEQATHKLVPIRCGMHARVDKKGHIAQGWMIIDTPRAFAAMGVDLFARAKAKASELATA